MKTTKILFYILILFVCKNLHAQEETTQTRNFISLNLTSVQIKDQINYGLVHKGGMAGVEYTHLVVKDKKTISYSAEFNLGMNGRKGVGINMDIKPVDLYYGFNIDIKNTLTLAIGPYFKSYYQWYLYPELHSGHMNWLSSHEIGPRIMVSIPVEDKQIDISISNSTAGIESRPKYGPEQYNYSLGLADIISNPNTNLRLAFQDKFNHYEMSLKLTDHSKSFAVGYDMEVFEFRPDPSLKRINHSIKLIWTLGKNK